MGRRDSAQVEQGACFGHWHVECFGRGLDELMTPRYEYSSWSFLPSGRNPAFYYFKFSECRSFLQLCKNIVLAGIGSLTLMEETSTSTTINSDNFLMPAEQQDSRDYATVCMQSLMDFNPMVHVSVEKGSLADKPTEFLANFDAVIVGRSSLKYRMLVNSLCRKSEHKVAFYTVDCRGSFGEIFVDLQKHSFVVKDKDNDGTSVKCLHYCSLEESIRAQWDKMPRRMSKFFFALRVLEEFEESTARIPGQVSIEDLKAVLDVRKSLCESQGVPETLVPEKLLERLLNYGSRELPPVSAIVGGILGQELLKAISSKGEPLKNFFFFDPVDGKGIIEDIPKTISN